MIKILRKIMLFSANQKKTLIKGILASVIEAVFRMSHVIAIAFVLQNLINGTATKTTAWVAFGIIVVGVIGQIIFNNINSMNLTVAGYTMSAESRISIANHLKEMSMGYFSDNNLGKITSVATNSAEQINDNLTRCVMLLARGIFMCSIIAISLFSLDWRMGVLCVIGIVMYFIVASYQQKINESVSKKVIYANQKLVNNILEYVQGIGVVKSYNLTGAANKRVKGSIVENRDNILKLEENAIRILMLQSLIFKVISFLMIVLSIMFYIEGSMDVFTTIMMSICSFIIFSDLEMSTAFGSLLRLIETSIDEISSILSTEGMNESGKETKPTGYEIDIRDISFSYDTKKIIDNVSLNIPQKSTLAIVGGSGSGKTTLCNLITRFWDVDTGEIMFGGVNIKDMKTSDLLSYFTMVFQDVYLFNDTVANNIKFGKQDATKEEIEEACKKACCHDFIMKLPQGYDTIIGEGGASISGGEKQRISIARAMIKDAPIVILDEATANVDPENEHQLQKAIKELTKSKTVIMIAHRLKTVQNADKIIVLEDGKIVESGNHRELIKHKGIYADFVGMREKAIGWKLGSR